MKKLIFILFVSLSLIQCNSDDTLDCGTVLCVGPEFLFEFIDADTGENILEGAFDNGAPDGFVITIGDDNTPLTFEQDYGFTSGQLSTFRFTEQFQISLENVFDVQIAFDIEAVSDGGCCQDYNYENVTVTNATFTQVQDNTTLILRIFI
ncbi:hypothetical protein [uncultured Dokdonia sp.]|uniref:hypothetical protein n=1 Tax=uncultured Dokdonia sp. TaxID=575653 RepID=UPI00261EE34D|nr:hypothetical protein [uncultured Dokdonia sp.]